MTAIRQSRGRRAEQVAAAYLQRHAYQIEAANVRFPVGELDLVAQDGPTLCFVEVRFRTSTRYGSAQESITWRKRQHFLKAVQWYLQRRRPRWVGPIRFDVVAINQAPGTRGEPELIRNAFRADE